MRAFKKSCAELDFLVEHSKRMGFVYGARMMGGGFGGCTINLVKNKSVEVFKHKVAKQYLNQFKRPCSIYHIKLSKGTHQIKTLHE